MIIMNWTLIHLTFFLSTFVWFSFALFSFSYVFVFFLNDVFCSPQNMNNKYSKIINIVLHFDRFLIMKNYLGENVNSTNWLKSAEGRGVTSSNCITTHAHWQCTGTQTKGGGRKRSKNETKHTYRIDWKFDAWELKIHTKRMIEGRGI
jgi:hypothetical protein